MKVLRSSANLLLPALIVLALAVGGIVVEGEGVSLAGQGKTIEVHLKGQKFFPPIIEIHPGDRILFINDDTEFHSLSLVNQEHLLNEKFIDPGGTYAFTLPDWLFPGEYELMCTIHTEMRGKIVVKDNL
jgi:plastocyanin